MSKKQKLTIEVKGTQVIFNCGEFAAIERSRQMIPITSAGSAISFFSVHDNSAPSYCRQRHFITITHAPQLHFSEIWRSPTAKSSQMSDASISMNHRFNPLEFEGIGKRATGHKIVGTMFPQSRISYANGVPSSSPGLRSLDRYPGKPSHHTTQPQRGCTLSVARSTPPDGTALRFDALSAPIPRVGLISFGQPWAGGRKPVGLMDSNTNSISSFLSLSSRYANGVPSSSPRLRGTRYPGTPAAHEFQPQRGCGPYVSSRAPETERTEPLTALDEVLTGLEDLK